MRVLLAGASGFLGTALSGELARQGHEVRRLVRRPAQAPDEVTWDPYRGGYPSAAVAAVEAVVTLSGAPIAHWPWTRRYRRTLVESRLAPARMLAETIATLEAPPALVCQSAVGFYGDRGRQELDESSPAGAGFLAELVQRWEGATEAARSAGARVVNTRSAVVLARSGGALRLMLPPFRAGIAGRLGDGSQYFPTISLQDWLAALTRVVVDAELNGPVNVVGPTPTTNAEFTTALGRLVHRPTYTMVPAPVLRGVLGRDLAGQLLDSIRARPARLLAAGFEFAHPTIDDQLAAALAE